MDQEEEWVDINTNREDTVDIGYAHMPYSLVDPTCDNNSIQ